MSNNNHHSNYTLAEINDYLQGRLSPAEMHAMERAALQDPFLADALEGLHGVDALTAEKDLAEIGQKLAGTEQSPAKLVRVNKGRSWFRIAASVILVAGAATIGWYLTRQETGQQELAQQANATVKPVHTPETQSDSTQNSPVNASNTKQELQRQKEQEKKQQQLKEMQSKDEGDREKAIRSREEMEVLANRQRGVAAHTAPVSTESKTLNDTIRALAAPPPPPQVEQMLVGRVAGLEVSAQNRNTRKPVPGKAIFPVKKDSAHTFSGKIIDANSVPVPNATVMTGKGQRVMVDSNGNFSFGATDSLKLVEITATGYKPKVVAFTPTASYRIVLEPEQNSLKEVLTSGYSSNPKKNSTPLPTGKLDISLDNIIPANGWEAFYADLNSRMPAAKKRFRYEQTSPPSPSKMVVLELSLDGSGKTMDATVLSSQISSINRHLINALKNGPAWRNADGSAATGKKTLRLYFAD